MMEENGERNLRKIERNNSTLATILGGPHQQLYKNPVFHHVIPLRPMHTFKSSTTEEVFGSKDRVSKGLQRGSPFCRKKR